MLFILPVFMLVIVLVIVMMSVTGVCIDFVGIAVHGETGSKQGPLLNRLNMQMIMVG